MELDTPIQDSNRWLLLRAIAGILALIATPSALLDLFGMFRREFDPLLAIFAVCTATFVLMCGWFALRGQFPASRRRMRLVLLGGLVVGGIGFAIGFFGPLIWAPDANQGPLLGIFITGPIGFVVGAALGWLYARTRPTDLPARS